MPMALHFFRVLVPGAWLPFRPLMRPGGGAAWRHECTACRGSLLRYLLLLLAATSARAATISTYQDTFILSNEGNNGLISQLLAGGYGSSNLYQTLLGMKNASDSSVSGILTPEFLATLQHAPGSSEIFTTVLRDVCAPGRAIAISTDGTVQVVSIFAASYRGQTGTEILNATISGAGRANFVYSTSASTPLTSWVVSRGLLQTTYDVFAIASAAANQPQILKTWPASYRWHTFYGSGNPDYGAQVAADGAGRAVVTGTSYVSWNGPAGQTPLHAFAAGGGPNAVVVKTDTDGSYLWHTFYPCALNGMAADRAGNIYLTGSSRSSWTGPAGQPPLYAHPGGASAVVVIKLDTSGTYQWHTYYGSGSRYYNNNGMGVAVDFSNGNLWVTGDSAGGSWTGPGGRAPLNPFAGLQDAFVLALDSNGGYQWHTFYGSGQDTGRAIAVDGWGVSVMGSSGATWKGPGAKAPLDPYGGDSTHTSVIFVLKLDAGGTYQWHTFHGAGSDLGYSMTSSDLAAAIYVVGASSASWNGPGGQAPLNPHHGDPASMSNILVLKLGEDGAYQWHAFYGTGSDWGYGVAIGLESVYVTGSSGATWDGPDGQLPANPVSSGSVALLMLGTDGSYRWHDFFGSSASGQGVAAPNGAVYVAGASSATWTGPSGQPPLHGYLGGGDLFLMKLLPESPSFVLSDESAHLIAAMVAAGHGDDSLYDGMLMMQANSDPSIAGIVTPAVLKRLALCPVSSAVLATRMRDLAVASATAVSDDCTVRAVTLSGVGLLAMPGAGTLGTMLSGVGSFDLTFATTQDPLAFWQVGATTYNAFAIAWSPRSGSISRGIPRRRSAN
jgi:hypothetical protein